VGRFPVREFFHGID
jgi:hypothetical protein